MRKYNALNIYTILTSAALWAIIILVVTQCACGIATLPPSYIGQIPSSDGQLPVKVATSAEPTDAAQYWRVTEALTVRACASVDCQELAYIKAGDVVLPMTEAISGAGCIGGGWIAIVEPAGFVCSLYLEKR